MSKKVKAAASWDIKEKLYEDLLDPSYAAAYVNEALLEGDEVVFKTAVADVIRARGVGKVAALSMPFDCERSKSGCSKLQHGLEKSE